jgi:hypothetical protein
MKETAVGVGYYKREQWNFLLESASDRENLEGTYEEWLKFFAICKIIHSSPSLLHVASSSSL